MGRSSMVEVVPFVAVSRVVGCGGGQLAHLLAEALRWPLYDVEKLAEVGNGGIADRIASLARAESAVFLDGGADLMLPREAGLRVYLVAAREGCVRNLMDRFDLTRREAEDLFGRTEGARAEYVRRTFCTDPFGETRFDMTLDIGHLGTRRTLDAILAAVPGEWRNA